MDLVIRLGMWTVDFNLGEDLLVDLSPRLDLPPLASSDLDDVLLEVFQSTFLELVLEDLVVLSLLSVRPSFLRGVEE